MMRHAIVDTGSGLVVNLIDYDTDISNTVPPGMEAPLLAIMSDTAEIGWRYQDGGFVNPNPAPSSLDPNWIWGPKFADVIGRGTTGVDHVR